ncbi:cysteine proteinase [Bimuria novae-zelandiae CBS 107.79]|uniref:ubiquitinyl hydrolase 1 n=1 Tax=Bimuria novae-zelandiae CBS 107.79 TaxID=1447943 RepID=A0A6A5USN6_9PLEO|nr:cysteine proteinase [Bimuria novae-zelandiae CBS 107.79]
MGPKKASTNGSTAGNPAKIDTSSPKDGEVIQNHFEAPPNPTESEFHEGPQDGTTTGKTVPGQAPEYREAPEMSLRARKRSSSESSSEESASKKSKLEEDDYIVPAPVITKENWQGYCEIESDPAYFSVILREIGIRGVDVQELHFLDPAHLMTLPPIHGLVLLFRAREFDEANQEDTCPDHIWFANQMPGQNSCATLTMIHTLLNVNDPDVDIGEHMRQFKNFTQDMTPPQRGHTFASWNFVKKIHNSFAKKMDMLENDKYIAGKAAQAEKRKAAGAKKAAAPKATSRSRTARRNSNDSNESDASVEEFEANTHHYIAFVPVEGQVWKLDGMDKQPTLMSEYDEEQGEMWFDGISERINALIATGDNDYGIFAITQSPLIPLRDKLIEADNTIKHVDAHLTEINIDWKEFLDEDDREPPSPSFMGSFSEEQRAANAVPGSIKAAIDGENLPALLERHCDLVSAMRDLVMEYMEKEQEVAVQNERAQDRRWDYGPAIHLWMNMLARNGYLEENLNNFIES